MTEVRKNEGKMSADRWQMRMRDFEFVNNKCSGDNTPMTSHNPNDNDRKLHTIIITIIILQL